MIDYRSPEQDERPSFSIEDLPPCPTPAEELRRFRAQAQERYAQERREWAQAQETCPWCDGEDPECHRHDPYGHYTRVVSPTVTPAAWLTPFLAVLALCFVALVLGFGLLVAGVLGGGGVRGAVVGGVGEGRVQVIGFKACPFCGENQLKLTNGRRPLVKCLCCEATCPEYFWNDRAGELTGAALALHELRLQILGIDYHQDAA